MKTLPLQTLPADISPEDLLAMDLSAPGTRALVRHPDGYYWLGADGRMQVGPYESAEEALADLNSATADDFEPEETLPEAENALGLADWLDPETGTLAEDTHTHIEEH